MAGKHKERKVGKACQDRRMAQNLVELQPITSHTERDARETGQDFISKNETGLEQSVVALSPSRSLVIM